MAVAIAVTNRDYTAADLGCLMSKERDGPIAVTQRSMFLGSTKDGPPLRSDLSLSRRRM